jgi:hypothetical protein
VIDDYASVSPVYGRLTRATVYLQAQGRTTTREHLCWAYAPSVLKVAACENFGLLRAVPAFLLFGAFVLSDGRCVYLAKVGGSGFWYYCIQATFVFHDWMQ